MKTLNVELSNSQLNKWKSGIKNANEVTLNLSSNLIGYFNDETNFLHKLLLTHTQSSANSSSANRTFAKTHYSKMIQSERIIDELIAGVPITVIKRGMQILISKAPELTKHAIKYFVKINR